MIKLQVIGNLGGDCIQKEVNGKTVINFNVAHSEKFKDAQGNLKERTTWVNCAYWTDRTAIVQYLTKGKTVYAEGTPEADGYTNKEGQVTATLRMRVQNLQLLGGNQQGEGGSNAGNVSNVGYNNPPVARTQPSTPSPAPASVSLDDDLPF
ncbi:single-stranded DNA-binding protein [Ferruginibacter sp. HRS2-29]|uniref:single-stranded DNA-binding protein n=1 Tax=Ferruginibacter sp. HRS2-29 TaxID=2487334 RepID=UPI0020CD2CF3|nr:single-stranded DNA-binding protein [Ferruginibacter sp. HRS2-29]MCP9752304.1 single-stranded DNA-binding protein [Ferruginibacter sp. HRS2-29]